METLLFEKRLLTRRTPSYIGAYYTNRYLSIDDSNKSVESALNVQHFQTTKVQRLLRYEMITSVKCVIHHYDGHIVPPKDSGELFRRAKKPTNKLFPNDDFVINLILIK